jgi:1,2-phenylacetyl-CoA epoxidase catalytic subunit
VSSEDIHGLGHEEFLDEVHSFEFWFQSVEGYLVGKHYGRSEDLAEEELDASQRDRLITVLCNYCVGETAALEGASSLLLRAPNRHTKIFLATQAVDEARHLEVLYHRLGELGIADPEAEITKRSSKALRQLTRALRALTSNGDWEAALFAQNVILEAMEFTVFSAHAQRADAITREVLEGIIVDERRHMGFGENALGRQLSMDPAVGERLIQVRRTLDPIILETFEETLTMLDVPADERPEPGRDYLAVVARLGFGP